MERHRIGVVILAIVSIAIAIGAGSGLADEPKATGTLSGRLVDPEGKAVGNVALSIESFDLATRSQKVLAGGRADAEGRFRLGPIEAFALNRYVMKLSIDGFAPVAFEKSTVTVYEGLDNDLGAIQVDLGRVYTGLVVDVDGKPHPGATVTLRLYRHELGHTVYDLGNGLTLKTDEHGRFRTPPIPVCQLGFSVSAPERRLAYVSRVVQPVGEEDIGAIPLEADVPFHGIILDEKGRGIAGVRIGGTVGHDATTDDDGRFNLRGFGPDASFQLNVDKPGFVGLVGNVKVTGNNSVYNMARGMGQAGSSDGVLVVTLKADAPDGPKPVEEKVVEKVAKKVVATPPEATKRAITGTIKREGKPVRAGWVSVWMIRGIRDPVNAPVSHGRMVAGPSFAVASAPIRDGAYSLDLPSRGGRFLVVQEPGQAITQVEMAGVVLEEKKNFDIDCVTGGGIKGLVKAVPDDWKGLAWVVAFNQTGVQVDARVAPDGSFQLPRLPPGEYGLKAGHDAYEDAETYPGNLMKDHPEAFNQIADPLKQAKVVKVESGKTVEGVEVVWPR